MTSPDEQTSLREAPPAGDPVGAATGQQPGEPGAGARQLLAVAVIALMVVGALVASSLGLTGSGNQRDPAAGDGSYRVGRTDPVSARAALARVALHRQEQALHAGDRRAYLRTWDPRLAVSQRSGATVYANLRTLGAAVHGMHYVAADPGLSLHRQRLLGGTSWTAEVRLSWRLRDFDEQDAVATLRYTFVQRGDTAYVADIEVAAGARRPVWLLGPLVVRRSERTLVAATARAEAVRVERLLRQAGDDVASVVSGWRGGLVAYVPGDVEQLESVLAATPDAYAEIAAVSTTVDGSREVDAPVAIVVNPAVIGQLGSVGARVVITHEATHVATGAAAVDVPLWVAEGFADYVGVGSVDVPLSVSAGAVIRDIRRNGLPDALPSDAAFTSGQGKLEVYYEQAWLAATLIAKEYGEDRLLAFYEYVVAAPDEAGIALRRELGTSRGELTEQWRRYLKTIARAA